MRKSWLCGAAAVVLVHGAWFGLIFLGSRADWFMAAIVVMLFVAMNVAGLGAFITAMTAPRRGFLLGLTMAPLSAALTVGSNLAFAATGNRVDLSGFYDNFGLLAVSLGLARLHSDDQSMLRAALPVYDALYAWCRAAQDAQTDQAQGLAP